VGGGVVPLLGQEAGQVELITGLTIIGANSGEISLFCRSEVTRLLSQGAEGIMHRANSGSCLRAMRLGITAGVEEFGAPQVERGRGGPLTFVFVNFSPQHVPMKSFLFTLLSLLVLPCSIYGQSDQVMIRLVDPLDEPEFYCIDVPGYGRNVKLEAPLMAHTLKRFGSADEMWIMNYPGEGQIYAKAYERCIEVASTTSGAQLRLKKPSDSPRQRFELTDKGTLVLAAHPELGVAVAAGKGTKAGGPSHLRRDINLKKLSEIDQALATWKLVSSAATWPEN
jgi:hypothetical protein